MHAHTTFSDGELTPEELVAEACRLRLAALAITDHDIVDGVAPALAAAAGRLEVVAGVEVSCNLDDHELHLLGLFVDHTSAELVTMTERSRAFRHQRAGTIVERLNELGVAVEMTSVEAAAGEGSIGRPHIAQAIVRHGASRTVDEAFQKFIGVGRPAFAPKPTLGVADVIHVVHRAGGVAILAHPASSRVGEEKLRLLVGLGLDGFEVDHPKHTASTSRKLRALIDQLGLLPSGGSDYHGPLSGRTKLGQHAVPVEWLEQLRRAADGYQAAHRPTEGMR